MAKLKLRMAYIFTLVNIFFTCLCHCETQKTLEVPLRTNLNRDKINKRVVENSEVIPHEEAVRRGLTSITKTMTNYQDVQYYATLYIGENDHEMTFMYDTGSDTLWFPLNNCSDCHTSNLYTPTSTFSTNGVRDGISYLDGSGYSGVVATDQVSLTNGGGNITMKCLGIDDGDPNDSLQSDGLLGLTASAYGNAELLVEALYDAGIIGENAFGVSYKFDSETSKIVFGGHDTSIVTNSSYLHWIDIEGTFHWELPLDSLSYGDAWVTQDAEIGILDTGTSLTYWETPSGDWSNLYSQITAGFTCGYSTDSGLRACYCSSVNDFEDITFIFNGVKVAMTAESYIEEESSGVCAFYIDGIDYSFSTPSILLGDSFLRNYYIYHDAANYRVAFYIDGEVYVPQDGSTLFNSLCLLFLGLLLLLINF